MRTSGVVAICLMGSLFGGCREDHRTAVDRRFDREIVQTLNNLGVENAILAQHTLFPYHFVTNGAQLNELGRRDFAVLARHFIEHPGVLNVRQGEAIPASLYQARVDYVVKQLKEAGIEPGRVNVSDGMPGGPGMPSEEVVTIVDRAVIPSARPVIRETTTR